MWCHVRHINPSNKYPDRILKNEKKIAEKLNYDEIEFPVQEKDFNKTEIKNNISINVFGYGNRFFQSIFQIKNLKIRWLNYIMYTLKILTDLCFTKQKLKTKNGFVKVVYNVSVAKMC